MWVDRILVDGAEIGLAEWLSRLSIRHGRGTVYDEPTASTADVVLLDPPRALTIALTVGKSLKIDMTDGTRAFPRFVGRITDLDLQHPELHVTAVGPLAEIKRQSVSTAGWPVETWSARVARVMAAAGVTAAVTPDPAFNPLLEPPPEQDIVLNGYLAELALTVGAAIYDVADGSVMVEAIGARVDAVASPINLDPSNVHFSPLWRQELDIVNRATVYYGPARDVSKTVSDAESVDLYGPRRTEIQTTIASEADAEQRAAVIVDRRSRPRWQIEPFRLLEASPAPFRIGRRVTCTSLPPSAPYAVWAPVLEGWIDRIDGGAFSMELWCSDPLASGFKATWESAGDGFTWADADAALAWEDVVTADQIGGLL